MPNPSSDQQTGSTEWPGKRLGLPDTSSRSIARPGRRMGALIVDYGIAYALGFAFFAGDRWAILSIFGVMQVIAIVIFSASVGHLVFGLRVVPLNPSWIGIWKPIARTALLCVVIPAVIWDRDQRGLHDRLVGTVLVRR